MTRTINMTEKRGLFKSLCLFIAPLMFTGILQLLYTASDLIICGKFGPEHSTGAISVTNPIVNLIVASFLGLATGVNVLMAKCFGANDKEKGQRVVYTAMSLSLVLGIAVGILGAVSSRYILILMETPGEVINLSTEYLAIYFIGVPFTMIYNFGASIMRAVGDTKRPFYFLTLSGVINILLNLLFVIVFKMGVAGVAICTSISQFCAATLVVISMLRAKNYFYSFKLRLLKFFKKETWEIVKIGLPAALQSFIFSFANLMIMSSISSLGTTVLDGNGASSSLEGFVYTAMNSCAQGAMTFASANCGARNKANISRVVLYSLALVMISWAVLTAIILPLGKTLLGLYVNPETTADIAAVIDAGWQRLFAISLTYFLCGLMDTFAYSLRGIGHSALPAVVSAVGACGFRLIWIFFIFPIPYFHNILWLALSYPISWLITAAVHMTCFIILFKRLKFEPAVEEPAAEEVHA